MIEGVSRTRNSLINGDVKNYDWDTGYTCHQLGSGAIIVQLAQVRVSNFSLQESLEKRTVPYSVPLFRLLFRSLLKYWL